MQTWCYNKFCWSFFKITIATVHYMGKSRFSGGKDWQFWHWNEPASYFSFRFLEGLLFFENRNHNYFLHYWYFDEKSLINSQFFLQEKWLKWLRIDFSMERNHFTWMYEKTRNLAWGFLHPFIKKIYVYSSLSLVLQPKVSLSFASQVVTVWSWSFIVFCLVFQHFCRVTPCDP